MGVVDIVPVFFRDDVDRQRIRETVFGGLMPARLVLSLGLPCLATHVAKPVDGSMRLPRLVGTVTV